MKEWENCRLQDIADIRDGTHDSPKQVEKGKPLITSRHIKNGKINISEAYFISDDDFYSINRRSKVDKCDILFSMIGTIGEMCIINEEPDFAIKNVALFKTCGDLSLSKWIYYYLKSNQAKSELSASIKGSTQEYISLTDLRNFPIELPEKNIRNSIIYVLSSLDDKIDLLHRQNATLEAMAEALFRQWFVVEAREEWEEKIIGDIFTIKGGSTPKTSVPEFWDGDIYWTSPRDLSTATSIYMFDTSRKITKEGLSQISSGVLPVGTLLLSSRAPIGYLAITHIPTAINQGYIAILPHDISTEYMYMWCKFYMDDIKAAANGSVFQEISKSVFKSLPFIVPPQDKSKNFEQNIKPIFEKILNNERQIRTLEKLRDTLLPKLMSGEVRVNYSESA